MMETRVSCQDKEVVISSSHPTVLIGERINPTGKAKLTAALQAGDLQIVREMAVTQMADGADILDVNVGALGVDEVSFLPKAVSAVMEEVKVPLCIDSDNPKALEAGLKVYKGKAIINSVNGQEYRLQSVLPLAKDFGAALVCLAMDDEGIPATADRRLAVVAKIVERATAMGIPQEDLIVDCLALAVSADSKAGVVTLEAIRRVRDEFGVNQTLGASNISFGLPERDVINWAFLAMAISTGVTCPVVHVSKVRAAVLATDVLLGKDDYSMRYIRAYRQRQASTK